MINRGVLKHDLDVDSITSMVHSLFRICFQGTMAWWFNGVALQDDGCLCPALFLQYSSFGRGCFESSFCSCLAIVGNRNPRNPPMKGSFSFNAAVGCRRSVLFYTLGIGHLIKMQLAHVLKIGMLAPTDRCWGCLVFPLSLIKTDHAI